MSENLMAQVVVDVKRQVKRLMRADPAVLDLKVELVNNVLPLIESAMAAVDERMKDAEAAIGELAEGLDDGVGIEPELTDEIKSVFALGTQLGEQLIALIPQADDIARKRYADLVAHYVAETNRVAGLLDDITLAPEDDEEGDDEDEDEDDDGGDDDDGEPLTAPGATKPTAKASPKGGA